MLEVEGMSISKEQVRHTAEAARLNLTDDETSYFAEQLSEMIRFAEKLHEIDAGDVQPTSHVLSSQNVLRDDDVRPSPPREKVLSNAPDAEDGQVKVPSVFE